MSGDFTKCFCALMLLAFAARQSSSADVSPPSDLSAAVSAWQEREDRLNRLEIVWQHAVADGIDRFSRFQSEWLPLEQSLVKDEARFQIDGARFLYQSFRSASGEHGYAAQDVGSVTSTVGEAFPDRTGGLFERAQHDRFGNSHAGYRPAQPFLRSFADGVLKDFWDPGASSYGRATVHKQPEYGSSAWAMLVFDDHPSHQLQTLEPVAILLALRPLHPLLQIRRENLRVQREPVLVEGESCLVVEEKAGPDAEATRTFWVDPQRQYAVRRYIGATAEGGAQVDISYKLDESRGWLPSSWSVMRLRAPGLPIQEFCRATVKSAKAATHLSQSALDFDYPRGTWVIDEPAGQQYLVKLDGQQRLILPKEFRWLPRHSELMQTETGEVGALIEAKASRRRYWQTAKLPLLVAGVMFAAALGYAVCTRRSARNDAFPAASS